MAEFRNSDEFQGSCFTEGESIFASKTRLFSKKRKDWTGRAKPKKIKDKIEKEKLLKIATKELEKMNKFENKGRKNLDQLEHVCLLCHEGYIGTLEEHQFDCKYKCTE